MPNSTAWGFVGLQHLFGQRVTQIGVAAITDAIQQSTSAYNNQVNYLLGTWAERNGIAKEKVLLPGTGTLQPLDEWGNPQPVRMGGSYDVGFPVYGGGTAWGTNRVTAALITVEEANRLTLEAFRKDADWLRRHMLSALLSNNNYTFDDKLLGGLTVQPLANNDAVLYQRDGALPPAIDNHYFAQAAAISDAANPFPAMFSALIEHPSNSGPYVVYVPTNLVVSIEALTAFVQIADPDIAQALTQGRIIATADESVRGPGDVVLGKTNKMWVVEWKALPDNYMIACAMGAAPFLRMREYDSTGLQGLFLETHSPDGNLFENRFIRYAGFGVRNRIAALVWQVGAASYSTPAGYTAPLYL